MTKLSAVNDSEFALQLDSAQLTQLAAMCISAIDQLLKMNTDEYVRELCYVPNSITVFKMADTSAHILAAIPAIAPQLKWHKRQLRRIHQALVDYIHWMELYLLAKVRKDQLIQAELNKDEQLEQAVLILKTLV